ncbi:hypothetical protein YPPY113_2524, partial [Yersinia pestis PY-113]
MLLILCFLNSIAHWIHSRVLWQMNIFFRKKYMIILLLSNAVLATEN